MIKKNKLSAWQFLNPQRQTNKARALPLRSPCRNLYTELNVSTSNPGIFSCYFSSSCLFFDPSVRAEQISDLRLRRKKQKSFSSNC